MASAESRVILLESAPFPLDCLAEVIDYINHPGTLFALLTVSKSVFWLAVARLYRDPFKFTHFWTGRASLRFVRHVLSLSPATDDMAQGIRYRHSVKILPPGSFYANYLSLMRNFTFVTNTEWASSWSGFSPGCTDVRPELTFFATAHRLAEVKGLTIDYRYMSFYTEQLHQLTSLQRVTFDLTPLYGLEEVHHFVQQYVKHFGAKGRQLKVKIRNIMGHHRPLVLKTLSLLDLPKTRSIGSRNILYYIAKCNEMDFGWVSTLDWDLRGEEARLQDLLPKCRSLKSLSLRLYSRETRALGWLLSYNGPVRNQDQQQQQQKTPPLESLFLFGPHGATMDTLNDGLQAFGHSLQVAHVTLIPSEEDGVDVSGIMPGLQLPKLRKLTIMDTTGKARMLQGNTMPDMPVLEKLAICGDDRYSFNTSDSTHQDDLCTTWEPMRLACLKELQLSHRTAIQFNIASFQWMSCLEVVDLSLPYTCKPRWLVDGWRWEWLSGVRSLKLKGVMTCLFGLDAFQALPELTSLSLYFEGNQLGWLDVSIATGGARQAGSVLSKTLKSLSLKGYYTRIEQPLMERILGPWFPEMTEFEFHGENITSVDKMVKTLGKRHPKLKMYNTWPVIKF